MTCLDPLFRGSWTWRTRTTSCTTPASPSPSRCPATTWPSCKRRCSRWSCLTGPPPWRPASACTAAHWAARPPSTPRSPRSSRPGQPTLNRCPSSWRKGWLSRCRIALLASAPPRRTSCPCSARPRAPAPKHATARDRAQDRMARRRGTPAGITCTTTFPGAWTSSSAGKHTAPRSLSSTPTPPATPPSTCTPSATSASPSSRTSAPRQRRSRNRPRRPRHSRPQRSPVRPRSRMSTRSSASLPNPPPRRPSVSPRHPPLTQSLLRQTWSSHTWGVAVMPLGRRRPL
mmetsp:Transcript_41936/g.108594  ORF Transcript_41936/g.108594 Transcript_41936/m.108594 type:complete len:287 (-) Transcript_41936:1101-1961(-)